MRDIGMQCQPRKQRNLHHIDPDHHMRQPNGDASHIPKIKIRGGIQDAGLQADGTGGQDTVNQDGDLFWQRHVKDDRQETEEECR